MIRRIFHNAILDAVALKAVASLLLLLCCCFSLCAQDYGADTRVARTRLHFPWNNTEYRPDYFGNAQAADSILALLSRLGEDCIYHVDVVAYASPEGPYNHNIWLSEERAHQLEQELRKRNPLIARRIGVRSGGESWKLLRERVVQDPKIRKESKDKILSILDNPSISDKSRKWRLAHTLEEGEYRYLLMAHYRYIRCLDITVWYRENKHFLEKMDADTCLPRAFISPVPVLGMVPRVQSVVTRDSTIIRPILGVSTNIPYDITYIPHYGVTSIPSFSLEYYPARGHYTVGADVEWPMWQHWNDHRFFQVNNITLWVRRYFKPVDIRFKGVYLLASANIARYGIGWEAKGWEGEGLGASVGAGYKITLGRRFFLDLGGALGFFYSAYDPYVWGYDATKRYYYDYSGDPSEFVIRNKRLSWFGPTRVYISIGIDLFNRKK